MSTFFTRTTGAALLAGMTALTLVACSGQPAGSGPSESPSAPMTASKEPVPAIDSAAVAAEWVVLNLTDGSHADLEYDNEKFSDAGLTIDAMWALLAAGDTAGAQKVATWLSLRDTAIDYAGDGEQAAYPSAMGKLGLAYLTPGVEITPEYKSAEELATGIIGRLSPEGRFRDISEWGDNSTPAGQAFDILLLVKLGLWEQLDADPMAALVAIACDDGSYPSMFDADAPCVGDVDTTGIVSQALVATGQTETAQQAVEYLLAAQTDSGRWQTEGVDSVNSTAQAVSALSLWDTIEAKDAVALGMEELSAWQLARTAAFPASQGGEGDLRATAQGILGLKGISYLDLLSIEPL